MTSHNPYAWAEVSPEEQERRDTDPTFKLCHRFYGGYGYCRIMDEAWVELHELKSFTFTGDFVKLTAEEQDIIYRQIIAMRPIPPDLGPSITPTTESLDSFIMPIVRCKFPLLVLQDITSVQPFTSNRS